MNGPAPDNPHPMAGFPQVGFLRPLVKNPNIEVGDYSYYDDPAGPEHFESQCVLYHFPFIGDKLVIGKFCALARGVKFIMNGANHQMSGFSTYPFYIFGGGWEAATPLPSDFPFKGDTVVGNDVWLGIRCAGDARREDRGRGDRCCSVGGGERRSHVLRRRGQPGASHPAAVLRRCRDRAAHDPMVGLAG